MYSRNYSFGTLDFGLSVVSHSLFGFMTQGTDYNQLVGWKCQGYEIEYDIYVTDINTVRSGSHEFFFRILIVSGPDVTDIRQIISDGTSDSLATDLYGARSFESPWRDSRLRVLVDELETYHVVCNFFKNVPVAEYTETVEPGMRRFFVDDYVAGEVNPEWADNTNPAQFTYGQPVTPFNWRPYYYRSCDLSGNDTTDVITVPARVKQFTVSMDTRPGRLHFRGRVKALDLMDTVFTTIGPYQYAQSGDIKCFLVWENTAANGVSATIEVKTRVKFL